MNTSRSTNPTRKRPARAWAPVLCLLLLVGMGWQQFLRPVPTDADPYHAQVLEAALHVPFAIDQWIGTDLEVPPAAAALLRPNVIFNRQFDNAQTGRRASVLFVQCRDTRDMAGHSPPRCYPAAGWTLELQEPMNVTVEGLNIIGTEYRFSKTKFNQSSSMVVFNFMILPDGEIVPDEAEVRRRAVKHPKRYLGAAQVQVQVQMELDRPMIHNPEQRQAIYRTLLAGYMPIIESVRSGERK